jgi:hypothetical protein
MLDNAKGDLRIWKVPTTPDAPERAVAQAPGERIGKNAFDPSDIASVLPSKVRPAHSAHCRSS